MQVKKINCRFTPSLTLKTKIMRESVDYGNPAYDDNYEHECPMCGKPVEEEGEYCSRSCWVADFR